MSTTIPSETPPRPAQSPQSELFQQILLKNAGGLLNMQSARNPYRLGPDEIDRVRMHRLRMKFVTETLHHRIESEGPTIENLTALANAYNDLAEYKTAQIYVESLLSIAQETNTMPQTSIAFMMSDKCNLRCKHCFIFNEAVFKAVPRKDELQEHEYVEIFKSLIASGRDLSVHITGGGEVFARTDFERIIKSVAALKPRFHISMQTNGHFPERLESMLEDEDVRGFFNVIQFSLDGLKDTHNAIRGNNNFEKLTASIDVARRHGVETSAITTILPENIGNLEAIREFSRSLGVKNHRFQMYFEGRELALNQIVDAREHITERDRSLVFHDATAPGDGCLAGIRTCVVRPDGSIETCRESYSGNVPRMVIGNVREHGLDLPRTLTSPGAIKAMRDVKKCLGCAAFCAR